MFQIKSSQNKGIEILREARWLDADRARAYLRILACVQGLGISGLLLTSSRGLDSRGEPIGTDFISFWTAARMAAGGEAASVYDPVAHHAAEQAFLGAHLDWYAFFYPPVFLMLCLPLALAPYLLALAGWLGATCLFYLNFVRKMVGNKVGVLPILAFPAVFITLGHGQNALLTTGLFAAGATLLGGQPLLAGVCFGLLCFKPQLALLLPLGLALGGRWRALVAMGVTALALCAASCGLFGEATWRAFLAEAPLARATLDQGLVEPEKMQSLFAAIRMFGGPLGLAYAGQALLAGAACLVLAIVLPRTKDALAQGVMIAAAAPLATPFLLDYDLMLLALPLGYLLTQALATQFRPFEKSVMLAAYMLPAFARPLALTAHIPLGAAVVTLLFAVLARRVFAEGFTERASSALAGAT